MQRFSKRLHQISFILLLSSTLFLTSCISRILYSKKSIASSIAHSCFVLKQPLYVYEYHKKGQWNLYGFSNRYYFALPNSERLPLSMVDYLRGPSEWKGSLKYNCLEAQAKGHYKNVNCSQRYQGYQKIWLLPKGTKIRVSRLWYWLKVIDKGKWEIRYTVNKPHLYSTEVIDSSLHLIGKPPGFKVNTRYLARCQ